MQILPTRFQSRKNLLRATHRKTRLQKACLRSRVISIIKSSKKERKTSLSNKKQKSMSKIVFSKEVEMKIAKLSKKAIMGRMIKENT